MGYRVNERNTGLWSVNGQLKVRRKTAGKAQFTENQKHLLTQVVEKLLDSMECDPSGPGHLHPESKWVDGGNFTVSMTGAQMGELYEVLKKLQ